MPARVLVIDSYDSFVYNLVQYLGELGADPLVHRNDDLDVDAALALEPDGVLLSPGPGRPRRRRYRVCTRFAPSPSVVLRCSASVSGTRRSDTPTAPPSSGPTELMHGKTSPIDHDGRGVFTGLPSPLTATRYHSVDDRSRHDPGLSRRDRGESRRHGHGGPAPGRPVEGVQFHPESVLTACGHDLLANFVSAVTGCPLTEVSGAVVGGTVVVVRGGWVVVVVGGRVVVGAAVVVGARVVVGAAVGGGCSGPAEHELDGGAGRCHRCQEPGSG